MVQVTKLKGDCYLPDGVSREVALRISDEIRQILNRDLEEIDIAFEVALYDSQVDQQNLLGAWGFLNASERRAWKNFLDYETFLENEWRKHDDS